MRAPLSWLRDFAPFEGDARDLGVALDELGLVVDAIDVVGEGLGGITVARVLERRPHPDADKVQLVEVDAGSADPLQVVCGAFNFEQGDLVPLAPVGAVLPDGMEIGRRKVRGQWSNGMLCSGRELGLSDDHAGIMVLPAGLAPGTPLDEALGIKPDVVFELDITPNRPDALSVAGVARDLAAKLHLPFSLPDPVVGESDADVRQLTSIVVESPELCPRFTARVLQNVSVGPSPDWVAARVTLAGMRSINNVVDASNYVMLELGQPTHPYDLDLLPGHGLLIRRAKAGESIVTLDEVERRLHEDDCLICDAEGTPVGIGGVMGGASSEISETTANVLLEAAYFTPMAIARTSKRLGLRTEASARFERGCDPEGIDRSVARFCELLAGASTARGMIDERSAPPERKRVRVRTARVNALLGTDLDDGEVKQYLEPIGFSAAATEQGVHEVEVPTFRPDVTAEVDVVEEVARHYGYSRIARTVRRGERVGQLTPYQKERRLVRTLLVAQGVSEAIGSQLVGPTEHERAGLPPAVIEAENPISVDESVLRTSLAPNLLRSLAFNAGHRNPAVRLFEIGHVFNPPRDGEHLPVEVEELAVVLAWDGDDAVSARHLWDRLAHALRLDGVTLENGAVPGLHPTRSARIVSDGTVVGAIGEIDPGVIAAYGLDRTVGWLVCDLERVHAARRRPAAAAAVSRFPSSDIDLAFVVSDDIPATAVEATVRSAGGELLIDVRPFDVYRGDAVADGSRSLAYRLRFNALDRTLTDEEVGDIRRRVIEAVESAYGARLRG